MKNKKVYIGISIVTVLVICIVASIFYIKANNKDVKYADFSKIFQMKIQKKLWKFQKKKMKQKK